MPEYPDIFEKDFVNKPVPDDTDDVSLCEALDRILNKGAVVVGEMIISVADIDLIYLGLQLVLTSIETVREMKSAAGATGQGGNRYNNGRMCT